MKSISELLFFKKLKEKKINSLFFDFYKSNKLKIICFEGFNLKYLQKIKKNLEEERLNINIILFENNFLKTSNNIEILIKNKFLKNKSKEYSKFYLCFLIFQKLEYLKREISNNIDKYNLVLINNYYFFNFFKIYENKFNEEIRFKWLDEIKNNFYYKEEIIFFNLKKYKDVKLKIENLDLKKKEKIYILKKLEAKKVIKEKNYKKVLFLILKIINNY